MLTVKEAAAELKMSTRFVYRLCGKGLIEHMRLGGRIRIASDAIVAFLEANKKGAKPLETAAPRKTLTLSCLKLK